MQTIKEILSAQIRSAFATAFPGADLAALPLDAIPSGDEAFGDFQCNGAMAAAKVLRLPPRKVAEQVLAQLPPGDLLAKAEIAGPGFINLTLADAALARHLEGMQAEAALGVPQPGAGKRLILDYSSPNVVKPMHIAHIRSTVIGDCLARVASFLGHRVIRENHVGDWGTPFGMLIEHLIDEGGTEGAATLEVRDLDGFYKAARAKFDASDEFQERARERVVKLQSRLTGTPPSPAEAEVLAEPRWVRAIRGAWKPSTRRWPVRPVAGSTCWSTMPGCSSPTRWR